MKKAKRQEMILEFGDDKSSERLKLHLTPMQEELIKKVLGLRYDTKIGRVEYYDDNSLEKVNEMIKNLNKLK